MPDTSKGLREMRNELTGDMLANMLKGAYQTKLQITVPKFKIESEVDGVELLKKLGVLNMFEDTADLSKISSTQLLESRIKQMDEVGTEAA
ncbi:hypothetical protein PENTCL1PPCAC_2952, partial [Pristionchus entomophagus]